MASTTSSFRETIIDKKKKRKKLTAANIAQRGARLGEEVVVRQPHPRVVQVVVIRKRSWKLGHRRAPHAAGGVCLHDGKRLQGGLGAEQARALRGHKGKARNDECEDRRSHRRVGECVEEGESCARVKARFFVFLRGCMHEDV